MIFIFAVPSNISRLSLWIVYPERLRGAPDVRAFVGHLSKHIKSWKRQQRSPVAVG
jgi:hypothetical protein